MAEVLKEWPYKGLGKHSSYMLNMPYIDTDRGAGRCHVCPICGAYRWSCWGNAKNHWEKHEQEFLCSQRRKGNDGGGETWEGITIKKWLEGPPFRAILFGEGDRR